MSFSIAGTTAVVTGAANGVGLSIARHFLAEGANVMLADMDEARLANEAKDGEVGNENAACFAGDLREKLTVANLLSATIDRFDRVDVHGYLGASSIERLPIENALTQVIQRYRDLQLTT